MIVVILCEMQARSGGVSVSGAVERRDDTLIVVIDGNATTRASRLNEAIREMAQQVRRRLPHGRASSWGVSVTCTSGGFSFGYGNLRGGGGGGTATSFPPCV